MKTFVLVILGFSIFLSLSADDYKNAEQDLSKKNSDAVAKLSEVRAKIQNEKIPLATKLSGLERSVEEKRRSLDRLQRLRDNKTVSLSALKREVEGRKTEAQFLSTLGSDYLANFEARLHVAEIERNQEKLNEIKIILDGDNTEKDKMIARMNLLSLSINRIEELLGGTQFDGQALDGSGKVREGTFVLSGPLAYFSEKSGSLAGLTESGRDLKPRIFELQDPQASTLRSFFNSKGDTTATLPVDATLGDAVKVAAAEDTAIEHIQKGGTWAYPIVFAAILSVIIALLKYTRLGGISIPPISVINGILEKMEGGDYDGALKQANALKGPFQKMFSVAVKRSGEGKKMVDEVMYEELLDAQIKLNSYLPIIQVIAATAPLMGLLGTVTGMIKTFKQITLFGTGDAKSLSEGISEALITTELGLVAAIPSLILYAILSRKSKGILSEMERLSSHFINEFPKKKKEDVSLTDHSDSDEPDEPTIDLNPQPA
jgi:biopolymer transport protein ExbB